MLWLVNFYVVAALFGWPWFAEQTNPLVQVLGQTYFYGWILGMHLSRYATVVERTYASAQQSFGETIDPCLARRYVLCDRHGRRARAAAQALLDGLARIEPPVRAKAADRHLREAFSALVAAQDVQRRAIEARDDAAFSRSISDITVAIGAIETARVEINGALPTVDLPAMH